MLAQNTCFGQLLNEAIAIEMLRHMMTPNIPVIVLSEY